jgi:uncharacterized membrane protein
MHSSKYTWPQIQKQSKRLLAIDAMRGMVMVLMAVDHASHAFNADRYVTDSFVMYQSGNVIPAVQFLVRWITHICAPTFVFLAGLSLALSIIRKQSEGIPDLRIDTDLLVRGLIILALDPLWMRFCFDGQTIFQVLYAIGGGLCCMALLRRLDLKWLIAIGFLLVIGGEGLAGLVVWLGDGQRPGYPRHLPGDRRAPVPNRIRFLPASALAGLYDSGLELRHFTEGWKDYTA